MNNLTFERVVLFILAILSAVALVITATNCCPTWEIVYVTFVAILIATYALWWLLLGGEDGDRE